MGLSVKIRVGNSGYSQKESAEWYEAGGEYRTVDGYQYEAKRLREIIPYSEELKIDLDFKVIDRDSFYSKNWTIPSCKLFIDNINNWWKD